MKRRPAVPLSRVGVGAGAKQQLDYSSVRRDMQGGCLVHIQRVGVGARGQQRNQHLAVASLCRVPRRRHAHFVARVAIRPASR